MFGTELPDSISTNNANHPREMNVAHRIKSHCMKLQSNLCSNQSTVKKKKTCFRTRYQLFINSNVQSPWPVSSFRHPSTSLQPKILCRTISITCVTDNRGRAIIPATRVEIVIDNTMVKLTIKFHGGLHTVAAAAAELARTGRRTPKVREGEPFNIILYNIIPYSRCIITLCRWNSDKEKGLIGRDWINRAGNGTSTHRRHNNIGKLIIRKSD